MGSSQILHLSHQQMALRSRIPKTSTDQEMNELKFTYIISGAGCPFRASVDTVSLSISILILVVFLKKNYKKLALFLIKSIN